MAGKELPKTYTSIRKRYPELGDAIENLGRTTRTLGPVDEKTSHLVQLAAAAAIRSEGAVHSHVKRALEAGLDGLEFYRRIEQESPSILKKGAPVFFEVGRGQAKAVIALLSKSSYFKAASSFKDLSGIDRVIKTQRS